MNAVSDRDKQTLCVQKNKHANGQENQLLGLNFNHASIETTQEEHT